MANIITIWFIFFTNHLSYAGINGTTVHSRANCGNNESITWYLGHPFRWRVVSIHEQNKRRGHMIDTGWDTTWRQAAVHWGEGVSGGWTVTGYHYYIGYAQGKIPFEITHAEDCNIYDGWWDY